MDEDIRKATEKVKTEDEGLAKAQKVLDWWLKDEAQKARDRVDPDLVMSNDWS